MENSLMHSGLFTPEKSKLFRLILLDLFGYFLKIKNKIRPPNMSLSTLS